jgi:hypothetical protein
VAQHVFGYRNARSIANEKKAGKELGQETAELDLEDDDIIREKSVERDRFPAEGAAAGCRGQARVERGAQIQAAVNERFTPVFDQGCRFQQGKPGVA